MKVKIVIPWRSRTAKEFVHRDLEQVFDVPCLLPIGTRVQLNLPDSKDGLDVMECTIGVCDIDWEPTSPNEITLETDIADVLIDGDEFVSMMNKLGWVGEN